MGNGLSPCMHLPATSAAPAAVKLVYWGGQTRLVVNDDEIEDGCCSTAGDVAAELPEEHAVCPADSFFVGLPVPVMSPGERLLPGRMYFVLPAERFSSCPKQVLTAATLASLSAAPGSKKAAVSIAGPGQCPFEYVKGVDGAAPLIRVLPEFIEKVISCDNGSGGAARRGSKRCPGAGKKTLAAVTTELCSTPELKRHYAQLVGPRNQAWSPRLETISECSKRRILPSPARLLSSR